MSKRKNNTSLKRAKQAVTLAQKNARAIKKQAEIIAKEKVKELRPYLKAAKSIDLRRNLTRKEKNLINKAWIDYQELTSRPVKIFRSKNKKNMKVAKAFSRQELEKGDVKFDVAFVPVADPKAKLSFKNNQLRIRSRYVNVQSIFFDMKNLMKNPIEEINRAINSHPNAKQFKIMAGKHLFNGGLVRSLVQSRVLNLMERYKPGGERYGKEQGSDTISGKDNHYKNWLLGLEIYEAENQEIVENYLLKHEQERQRKLRERKNTKKKRHYRYGKKF